MLNTKILKSPALVFEKDQAEFTLKSLVELEKSTSHIKGKHKF